VNAVRGSSFVRKTTNVLTASAMPHLGRPSRVAAAAALGAAALLGGSDAAVLRKSLSASRVDLEGYSFEKFSHEFGRTYDSGSKEYTSRKELFQASLLEVKAVNARNAKEGRLWKAGIHQFMDWSEAERRSLNGYKPSSRSARSGGKPAGAASQLQTGNKALSRRSGAGLHLNATLRGSYSGMFWSSEAEEGGLSYGAGPALRNQGNCGSCWAISAVEAVEAQLQRNGDDSNSRLSAQALVDCVPNPQHCGGSGGCDGATGELAYSFMRDHGIPMEGDLPYTARTQQCPQQLEGTRPWQYASSRVRVGNWDQLPSNKMQPLMQALVEKGPVVVAVDANNWFNYDSGIFDGCDKDAILGHAVLAKGYAADSGNKYWLIQNSWGANWGESGHIRLIRRDNEDAWCGTDSKPEEGVGCTGGPSEVTVCGTCGLLYDPIVPQDVHIESGAGGHSLMSFDSGRMSSTESEDSFDSITSDVEEPES